MNILAYREDESTSPIEFDSLPEADLDVPAILCERPALRRNSRSCIPATALNGIVRVYYLDANASNVFDVLLGTTGDLLSCWALNAQRPLAMSAQDMVPSLATSPST